MADISKKDDMLARLEKSEYTLFPVYDDNGVNVGVVNRVVVKDCIEAGYVFDLENVPYSVVAEVNPIDWSELSYAAPKKPLYDVVRPLDSVIFPRRRLHA